MSENQTLLGFLNRNWQFIIILLLVGYVVYLGNKPTNLDKNSDKIDSILRVLSLPQQEGNFTNQSPQPIIITIPQQGSTDTGLSNELLQAFEDMKDDNEKTRAYAEAIAKRVYNNSYSDSLVSIDVKDIVEGGKLTKQDVNWTIKPQEITYHENVYYMKPKYTISAGLQVGSSLDGDGNYSPQLMPTLGYKGRNGWGFKASVNLLNTREVMIGFDKDIFTKYNKVKKLE